jgi:hypothetical protein
VTFTPANWNVPQNVTVTGVAVGPANGNVAYTIDTSPAVSTDPSFNGLNAADVSVTNNAAVIPSISIADAAVNEGNVGPTTLTFTVSLSQTSPRPVTVNFATQDQTATSTGPQSDYGAANGTLTFNPGETGKTFGVTVIGDTTVEPNETFKVTLSSPNGGTVADGEAIGTITNDDDNGGVLGSCIPAPNIIVQTQATGPNQLQVTVKAETSGLNEANFLQSIQFGVPTNATIQMLGQGTIGTNPINLPVGTKQIVFLVTKTNPAQAFHVPFTVKDACNTTQSKFVGGGPGTLQ